MAGANILVVDDEPDIRNLVQEILQDEGYNVTVAENAAAARESRRVHRLDLALLDIWMPDIDGISLLREWAGGGDLPFPVIMMSGHGSVETAVEATKLGAYDFIEKPISLAKLLLTVERALETGQLRRENEGLKQKLPSLIEPVGVSDAMRRLRDQLKRLGRHDTWVLLVGEPGVGKATVARYLHAISQRAEGPFVELNAGAMPAADLCLELFGSEENPEAIHYGRLEQARGGTLFLDEVNELDADTQGRLASALEIRTFTRAGGRESLPVDIRLIASTRTDLEEEVRSGRFREDLFYQLNVVPLTVPPLRERPEDVPELLAWYADYFPARESLPYRHFSVASQNRLRHYAWPGNVRELKNLVQRLLILGTGEIELDEVEKALGNLKPANDGDPLLAGIDPGLPLREARERFERAYLLRQLKEVGGSVGKLAKLAGMERTHLYRKLRSLDIDPKKAS